MSLQATVTGAVKSAIETTIGSEIEDIVARETRRALRDHEHELTEMVKMAVNTALAEIFNGGAR